MARIDVRMLALASLLVATAPAAAVVLTGEVQAVDAQAIYTPASNIAPVVVRYFVPEGERVEKGDVVLRIDPGQSGSQVREMDAQIDQSQAGTAKELAELRVKEVDARIALADAAAALENARIDASIPATLISALDYDKYQGELERAGREHALKQRELEAARTAVARRERDGALQVERLRVAREYHLARVGASEVRADRDGIVVHGFNNNWIGGRIDEGSSTMPGSKAGEVVSGGEMRVRAWALVPDRSGLEVGQAVQVAFDALPGSALAGRITSIAGAPDRRSEWGDGRYFSIDIALPPDHGLALLPGMSVRVIADADAAGPGGTVPTSTGSSS